MSAFEGRAWPPAARRTSPSGRASSTRQPQRLWRCAIRARRNGSAGRRRGASWVPTANTNTTVSYSTPRPRTRRTVRIRDPRGAPRRPVHASAWNVVWKGPTDYGKWRHRAEPHDLVGEVRHGSAEPAQVEGGGFAPQDRRDRQEEDLRRLDFDERGPDGTRVEATNLGDLNGGAAEVRSAQMSRRGRSAPAPRPRVERTTMMLCC